ncbi:MAG TPA: hypothetical protein VFS32_04350 [Candidatus Limnocylindrales bacterium]|nr:hypothetical protein [Candidatus Limnocylindrales bacterium]
MTEQRGDAGAEAIAHDADAPSSHAGAGRDHGPDDDAAHHAAVIDDHDDHAHMGEALGPVDLTAWTVGVLGVVLGLVVAVCFALASAGFA